MNLAIKPLTKILVALFFANIAIDQVTKYIAEHELLVWQDEENLRMYQGDTKVVKHWDNSESFLHFNFNYVRNLGAAWGFLSNWDDRYRIPFFYIVTSLAIIMLSFYLYQTPSNQYLNSFGLTFILSGAVGNFLDRIVHGYVIDFIQFEWQTSPNLLHWAYTFPSFNWADSCITTGIIMILLDTLKNSKLRKLEAEADKARS